MRTTGIFVVATAALAAIPAYADGTRSDVPIKLDIDSNSGRRVYSISVMFGTTPVQSVLDTGSTPAQVLPGSFKAGDAQNTGQAYNITYGGSRIYRGTVQDGVVTIGAVSGSVGFGVPTFVGCTQAHPNCPNRNGNPQTAVFGGLYNAIVGAKVGSYTPPSVFFQLGAHRFIVTAPRLGENNNTGDLLLNPTTSDGNGFTPLKPLDPSYGAPVSAVAGCLRNLSTGYSFCGGIVPDTGTTGITIEPAQNNNAPFNAGDSARIEFTDGHYARIAGVDFTVGQSVVEDVTYGAVGQYSIPVIKVGQVPYLGFRIMTDLDQSVLSVSPRGPSQGGTFGHVP